MSRIRIGIICPSEIAFRRFLPALKSYEELNYVGVAVASAKEWFGENYNEIDEEQQGIVLEKEYVKAENFQKTYGGKIFHSYSELINSKEINAVYLPLPPALHFIWAKRALENGKHVLVEKPATTSLQLTEHLLAIAQEKQLAFHENYMFVFHKQLKEINEIIRSGVLGDIRLFRIDFGFPQRAKNDFRYCKTLGGGALLDCGGYTLKYAALLLGDDISIDCATSNYVKGFDVDIYGSATVSNKNRQVIQVSFGMDNQYKCDLEVWGSKGKLVTGRVLTAQAGFIPSYVLQIGAEKEEKMFSADDTFLKSLNYFVQCIKEKEIRDESYRQIQKQAELIEEFRYKAEKNGYQDN